MEEKILIDVNEFIKNINEKIYRLKNSKYRKFQNLKISYISVKQFFLLLAANVVIIILYLKKKILLY